MKDESPDGDKILKIGDANFNWEVGRDHKITIDVDPEIQTVSVWCNPIGVTPLPNQGEAPVFTYTINNENGMAEEGQIVVGSICIYDREPAAGVPQASLVSGIEVIPLPLLP